MPKPFRRVSALAALAVPVLTACADSSTAPDTRVVRDRPVVLNGVGQTGVTVVVDTGGPGLHLSFDPFDGATFTVERDTALSTSSSFSGDLLFVAAIGARTVQKLQLPARSNPAGAVLVPAALVPSAGSRAATVIAVALRNTGALALVTVSAAGGATVSTLPGAGLCPSDVVVAGDALYSADANQRCSTDYTVVGPARLVRVPLSGASRDTIRLGSASVGAARAFASGDIAYVATSGAADAAGMVRQPAAVAKVDLRTRTVVQTAVLPAGIFGFSARLAEDGRIYVSAATGFDDQSLRVYAIDAGTMAFAGVRAPGQAYLALATEAGQPARCAAATADRSGTVYCVENGRLTATLRVFDASGRQVRSAPAGSLAFDVALR